MTLAVIVTRDMAWVTIFLKRITFSVDKCDLKSFIRLKNANANRLFGWNMLK